MIIPLEIAPSLPFGLQECNIDAIESTYIKEPGNLQVIASIVKKEHINIIRNITSKIAVKNKFKVEKSNNFTEALKKISSKEKKLIVCFGSLYNCGNILNKN